jgi:hypothetical protein
VGYSFYCDASIPVAVAKALALVRGDILYPGQVGCPVASPAVKDEEWLPIAGSNEWIVLMRDKHIRTRPGERRQLMDACVRAFALTGAGNYTRWRTMELLVRRWPEMETIAATEAGPYIYAVTQHGTSRLTR